MFRAPDSAGFRYRFRLRLAAGILLILVSLTAFAVYQVAHEIDETRQHVEQLALSMARLNAAEIARRISETEHFLEKLAANPDIRALDPKRCGHWFDHFRDLYPEHSNLLTKDINGDPVCSALVAPPGVKINPGNYLPEVQHKNGFAIGTPNLGALSHRWVVPLDYPLRDGAGNIIGTVSAPLDLLNFNPFLGGGAFKGLPDGTTATLFAPDMTMLGRSVDAEKWVGSRRLQVPELAALVAGTAETTRFVSQVDRIERIHGAAKVPGTAWTTLVSIPAAPYDAAVNLRIRLWVGAYSVILLVCLAAILAFTLGSAPPADDAAEGTAEGMREGMSQSGEPSPHRWAAPLAFIAILLVTLGLFAFLFQASYRVVWSEALVDIANVADILTLNLEDTLERAQSDLSVFVPQVTDDDLAGRASAARRADLEARLGYHLRSFPAVIAYAVFDSQGQLLFWGSQVAQRVDFGIADRRWFRQLRDDPGRELVLSEVLLGKVVHHQSLIMGKALRDGDGRFKGAIVAAIDLAEFQRRIDRLDIGENGLVALRRTDDLTLVVRRPQIIEQINEPAKAGGLSSATMSGRDSAGGEFTSPIDHVRRLYAYRLLHNFPFSVVVAISADEHFAPWRQQTMISGAAALALVATLLLLYRRQLAVQRQLRASEGRLGGQVARFQAVLAGASDGIHVLDARGTVLEASDSFCRMLGYRREEVIGMNAAQWDAQMSPEELAAALASQLAQVSRSVFETRHRRKDGSEFPVEISGYPFILDGQRVIFNSSRDITGRKALEDRLRQTNIELEQFAYVASHDLRQPLRMVTSYLDLIDKRLGSTFTEEIRKFFDFAIGGARRMDRLILALLEYSRTGRKTDPLASVPLARVMEECLINLSVAIAEAGAEVTVEAGLPEVEGDAVDLVRLFQNLMANAINYRHPERRPVISVKHRREGKSVVIAICDNGMGIAPEFRERVFAVFQRLVPNEAYEGTGIGLAICKKIVDRHGGSIWIEDAPGGGCVFLVRLPG